MWSKVVEGKLPVENKLCRVLYKYRDEYYKKDCFFTVDGIPDKNIPPNSFYYYLLDEQTPCYVGNVEYWTYLPKWLEKDDCIHDFWLEYTLKEGKWE